VRQDWRVEFVCGGRADRAASGDFQLLQTLSKRLSCAPEDLVAAVEKALTERESRFKDLRGVLQELAEARAALLVSTARVSTKGARVVAELLRDSHPDLLLPLATEVARHEGVVGILILEESGQFVLAQHPAAKQSLPRVLKEVFAVYPGKGGGANDFIRAKLSEPRESAQALALAKKLLLG
jgi:alanyl-tRNA synthetase